MLEEILEARGYQVTCRSDSFVSAVTGDTIECNWLTATKGNVVVKHFWSGGAGAYLGRLDRPRPYC